MLFNHGGIEGWGQPLKGSICWVVGTGPSFELFDLTKINGPVFAINAAYTVFTKPNMHTFWFVHDARCLRDILPHVSDRPTWSVITYFKCYKVWAALAKKRKSVAIKVATYNYFKTPMVRGPSGALFAIQVAHILGAKTVVLVGVDFSKPEKRVYASEFDWYTIRHQKHAAMRAALKKLVAERPDIDIRSCSPYLEAGIVPYIDFEAALKLA